MSGSELISVRNEWQCGSTDGYLQGLNILGKSPLAVFLQQKLHLPKTAPNPLIQQTACHIITSVNDDPDIDLETDQALQNRLQTIEFMCNMSGRYGHHLTTQVYLRIQEETRTRFDSGEATFSKEEQQQFEARLVAYQSKKRAQQLEFELPAAPRMPALPSQQVRMEYWPAVTHVIRSQEGHIGVFYPHATSSARDLVVKAPLRPMQECFASRVFQRMDFLTPDTICIDRDSTEGQAIEKMLQLCPEFAQHKKDVAFTRFFIQGRVYGRTIEEIDEASADLAFTNDLISLQSLLQGMGVVAAVDVFFHYQDRLPHIGYPNWGNLMCVGKRLSFAVAIDQSVELSSTSVFQPTVSKLGRVKQIVLDVYSEKPVSQAAQDIWEELPAPLKKHISEEAGLAALQEGLLAGFAKIKAKITAEALD